MAATLKQGNKFATEKTSKLVLQYSLPAVISGLVGAFYNMVDQVFIGNIIGIEGNAATNVAFPLVTLTTAVMLLVGIGSTANFSISLGKQDIDSAKKFVGNLLSLSPIIGLIISVFAIVFTEELLWFFGATENNIELATTYVKIVAIGYPFFITTEAATKLVRADGSPKYSMFCSIIGVTLNCVFNPLFMIVFNMGIAGAAWATVTGQIISFALVIKYFFNFKTFKVTLASLKPSLAIAKRVCSLGFAAAVNQISLTATQIVLNNTLTYYGALSVYGTEIPLACVGVITKVTTIYTAVMVGISQGAQPVFGYNYGAKNYSKVRETYFFCVKIACTISIITFLVFQIFPRNIISIFGSGDELYFEFGVQYFRIFLMLTFLNGIQPISSNFFTAIGKPIRSAIVSFTKQIFFLIPLILILPMLLGINGVLFAGPIADLLAFIITLTFLRIEFKNLKIREENELQK